MNGLTQSAAISHRLGEAAPRQGAPDGARFAATPLTRHDFAREGWVRGRKWDSGGFDGMRRSNPSRNGPTVTDSRETQHQIHRYESGTSQPTPEVIRRLALILGVSADRLIFDDDERGPSDDLRNQFEAIAQFDAEDRRVAKDVLDGLILKNQAKRLASSGVRPAGDS